MKSVPHSNTNDARIVLIDLLRSISIFFVLALHLGTARFAQQLDRPVPHYWNLFARNGAYGVSIFFVLSGFLITRILMNTQPDFISISYQVFYARRAGRILPLLGFVVMIGVILLRLPAHPSNQHFFCFDPGLSLKGVLAAVFTFSFNWYDIWNGMKTMGIGMHWGVLWSLSIEEQFYLFYPILLRRVAARRKVLICLFAFVIAGIVYRWWACRFHPGNFSLSWEGSFGAFDQIAAGCVLFFISERSQMWMKKRPVAALSLTGAGAMVMIWTFMSTNINSLEGRFVAPPALALGVLLFLWGGLSIDINHTLPWSILCLPGRLSYGIYLLHTTVLFFGWTCFRQPNPWAAFLLFLTVNTGIAYFSYSFYEKPANAWIRRRIAAISPVLQKAVRRSNPN